MKHLSPCICLTILNIVRKKLNKILVEKTEHEMINGKIAYPGLEISSLTQVRPLLIPYIKKNLNTLAEVTVLTSS